jgi:uncharacterized membrane protein (DUF2068 family)
VDHSKLLGLLHEAFTVDPRKLGYIAIGLGAYAVVEVIEGVGLWLVKRWGEYFAMIVTSLGLPYEIYDLANKVTVLRVVAFLINLALVLYLVLTKRLFGVRGGKAAYEARLRSESIMDAEIAALAAEQAEPGRHAKPVPAEEPGPAAEPAPARAPFEAAAEPPVAHDPFQAATEPAPAHEPFQAAKVTPVGSALAEEAPVAEPPAAAEAHASTIPVTTEAVDADEAEVEAPPPLPRRRPRS